MIGKNIALINRSPYRDFKRISGKLIGREIGILVVETPPYSTVLRFRLDEWEIESIKSEISVAAVAMGRKGGSSKSERKRIASRENGKRGGRPKCVS